MPKTSVMHRESWVLDIRPDEGDDWPAIQAYSTGPMIKVDQITVYLTAGHRSADVKAYGRRLKKDGTPGQGRSQAHLYNHSMPDWIEQVIERERARADLGEGVVCPSSGA